MYPSDDDHKHLASIKTYGIGEVPLTFRRIDVDQLHRGPWQFRRDFSEASINEMASSLLKAGTNITPLIVTPRLAGGWSIVCGERRWRGAQKAQLHELNCLVANYTEEQASFVSIVDNIQREQFNPIEEANALKAWEEKGLTHDEIAESIGKSRGYVSNYIRLVGLDIQVRDHLISGKLSASHGRLLCSVESNMVQRQLASAAVRGQWSYKRLQQKINEVLNKPKPVADLGSGDPDVDRLARIISEHTGYTCIIKKTPSGWQAGFAMTNNEQFAGLLERMGIDVEL